MKTIIFWCSVICFITSLTITFYWYFVKNEIEPLAGIFSITGGILTLFTSGGSSNKNHGINIGKSNRIEQNNYSSNNTDSINSAKNIGQQNDIKQIIK